MTMIDMAAFKELKIKKGHALQYAKAYGVSINTVLEEMDAVEVVETTVVRMVTEEEALEALGEDCLTAEELLKCDTIKPIEWNPDIPW